MTLAERLRAVEGLDEAAMRAARERQDRLTKPPGSLGRLEGVAVALAGIQGRARPAIRRPAVVVAAADHGVTAEDVSAYPAAVTGQMVANFLAGGAAINRIAASVGARLSLVDAGVAGGAPEGEGLLRVGRGHATGNIRREPAMAPQEAERLLEAGAGLAERLVRDDGVDLLALGEMGIGNTTCAAALASALLEKDAADVTGPGTGVASDRLASKVAVVRVAVARARGAAGDHLAEPVTALAQLGGFEIALLAGCCLGAARARCPVILDGFPTSAAGLLARALAPAAGAYLLAGHRSAEPGHGAVLAGLGLAPLLDLEMRLGEASGAALAVPVVRAAADTLAGMATFDEARVAEA